MGDIVCSYNTIRRYLEKTEKDLKLVSQLPDAEKWGFKYRAKTMLKSRIETLTWVLEEGKRPGL